MKLRQPELIDRLAAEYVLGTLRGAARARFERHAADDARVRDAIEAWQERLLPLAAGLPGLQPPAAVRIALERRLFGADVAPASSEARASPEARASVAAPALTGTPAPDGPPASSRPPAATPWPSAARRPEARAAPRWWQRLAPWQAIAAFATMAAIVLGVALLRQAPPVDGEVRMAVLQDATGQAGVALRVERDAAGRAVVVARVLRVPAALDAGHALELWAVPSAGAPRSLGLIDATAGSVRLAVADASRLFAAAALAVSIEPRGGSPTGAPTGPVVYQGALHPI